MVKGALVMLSAFVLLFASGCVTRIRTGRPITEEQVRAINPGLTTRDEVLGRFGAPTAIIGNGEIAVISSPSVVRSPGFWNPSTYRINADTFFELFPAPGKPVDDRRIYYYHFVESARSAYFLVFGAYTSGSTKTDRLWVLVDEKTGTVKDYAFKKHGGSVVFGRTAALRSAGQPPY